MADNMTLNVGTGGDTQVTHNGFTWNNSNVSGLNVWEPGVFEWVQV